MKVLIVHESMYGNTAAIARAIGEGFASSDVPCKVAGVDEVSAEEAMGYDLLVVGGPTHAHGMSQPTTRMTAIQDAKNAYPTPTSGEGLRGWLERLPAADGHVAAAFDTRIDLPAALTGSASKGVASRLHRRGFRLVDRASFLVTKQNQLVDGELTRARTWGASLAHSLVAA
jgi:hypothetical protein